MLRAIAGVIVGYIVMFVVVFVAFTAAYLAMGADRAFRPDSYDVSMLWIALSVIVSLVAAIAGGMTCAAIAEPGSKAPTALAAVVLVLGLLSAVPVLLDDSEPVARTGTVSNMDAMMQAKTPVWSAITTPILGVVGVMIGAGLVRKKPSVS